MKSLPLPIRVAAGLAVTAVEQARTLPAKLAGLPVTVASQALQVSMRVQQQVTELAIRGDEVLAGLRPVDDAPEWATFDEDVEDDGFGADRPTPFESAFDRVSDEAERRNGHHTAGTETFATPDPWAQEERALAEESAAHDDAPSLLDEGADRPLSVVADPTESAEPDPALDTPEPGGTSGSAEPDLALDTPGSGGTGGSAEVAGTTASDAAGTTPFDRAARSGGAPSSEDDTDTQGTEGLAPVVPLSGEAAPGDDRPLAERTGYDGLSLPQLRARLRRFTADELTELLEHERAHGNRPSYVGMLTRRIATVRDQR